MGEKRTLLLYILFAVIVAACSLYLRFPAKEVGAYLDRSIQGIQADLYFAATDIKPWFPVRLKFVESELRSRKVKFPLFRAEELIAGPRVVAFLQGKKIFCFDGKAYGGDFSGSLQVSKEGNAIRGAAVAVTEVDLSEFRYLVEVLNRKVTGIFSGEATLKSDTFLLDGEGNIELQVADGRAELTQALFGLDAVAFDTVTVNAQLAKRKLTINIAMKGSELQGDMSGVIGLVPNINESRLKLIGSVEPLSQLFKNHPQAAEALNLLKIKMKNGKYSFAVSGTVHNPLFALI